MSKKTFSIALVAIILGLMGVGLVTWNILNNDNSDDLVAEANNNIVNNGEVSSEGGSAPSTPTGTSEILGFSDHVYIIEEPLTGASTERNVYVMKKIDNLNPTMLILGESLGMGKNLKVEENSEEIFISKNAGEIGESRLSLSLRDNNGYFSFWRIADPQCSIQTPENVEECGNFNYTAEEAEEKVKKLISEISNFSADELDINVFESEMRIAILVKAKIDGVLSDQLTWVFDFGKDGIIYSASGYLSSLESIGSFRVLSAEETLERGNQQEWKKFIYPGPPNPKVDQTTLPDPSDFTVAEKKVSFANPGWLMYVDTFENNFYIIPSWITGNTENVDTWNFIALNNGDIENLDFLK